MRCNLCRESAGWFRRRCRACAALWAVYQEQREGANLRELLQHFETTDATPEQIEAFLRADPRGRGSIQDQIATDMTNRLLRALGHSAQQTPSDVKRIRARGTWKAYGQRPPD